MELLIDEARGVDAAPAPTLVLAHGAGAAMDSRGMTDLATRIAERGIRVIRFEFAYMAARRDGARKPPPRAETLVGEYRDVLDAVAAGAGAWGAGVSGASAPGVVIGGRSMGGRVASLLAADAGTADVGPAGGIAGVVCVSYPFHPPAKPEQTRTAHLVDLRVPTLIVQGTRDPFGSPDEIAGYRMSNAISTLYLEDGDHDLRPRKSVSGFTHAQHLDAAADAVAAFVRRVTGV